MSLTITDIRCTECGWTSKYTPPNDGEIREVCRECGADAMEVVDGAA